MGHVDGLLLFLDLLGAVDADRDGGHHCRIPCAVFSPIRCCRETTPSVPGARIFESRPPLAGGSPMPSRSATGAGCRSSNSRPTCFRGRSGCLPWTDPGVHLAPIHAFTLVRSGYSPSTEIRTLTHCSFSTYVGRSGRRGSTGAVSDRVSRPQDLLTPPRSARHHELA